MLQPFSCFYKYWMLLKGSRKAWLKVILRKIHISATSAAFFSVCNNVCKDFREMVSASCWRLFGARTWGLRFLHKTTFSWGSHVPSDTVRLLDLDDVLLLSPVFKPLSLRELL